MLKQTNINWRQADETAPAPLRQFKSPQDELRWLKENRRNLQGFVRVLEVIEADKFFTFRPMKAWLPPDWLDQHGKRWGCCIGTLLHWFFADRPVRLSLFYRRELSQEKIWEFHAGRSCLAMHLNKSDCGINELLAAAVKKLKPGAWRYFPLPFGRKWPVSYSAVFRELAAQYPDK